MSREVVDLAIPSMFLGFLLGAGMVSFFRRQNTKARVVLNGSYLQVFLYDRLAVFVDARARSLSMTPARYVRRLILADKDGRIPDAALYPKIRHPSQESHHK